MCFNDSAPRGGVESSRRSVSAAHQAVFADQLSECLGTLLRLFYASRSAKCRGFYARAQSGPACSRAPAKKRDFLRRAWLTKIVLVAL